MEHVLIELRQNQKYQKYIRYPDVCFEIGDKQIKANKCLLASKTDYFVKLFTYHPELNIKLTGFDPDVFEYVILLLYNKKMPISKVENKDKLFSIIACMHEMLIDTFKIEHIKRYISFCENMFDLLNLKPYINEKDLINYSYPNNKNTVNNSFGDMIMLDESMNLFQQLIENNKTIVVKELFYLSQLFSIEDNIDELLPLIKQQHIELFNRNNFAHYHYFVEVVFQNWTPNLNEFGLLEYLLRQMKRNDPFVFRFLPIYYRSYIFDDEYCGYVNYNYNFKKETINSQEYIAYQLIYCPSRLSKSYYLILPLQYQNLYYKEDFIGENFDTRYTKINHIVIIEEPNLRTIKCNESVYSSKLILRVARNKKFGGKHGLIKVEHMRIDDQIISPENYHQLKYYIRCK